MRILHLFVLAVLLMGTTMQGLAQEARQGSPASPAEEADEHLRVHLYNKEYDVFILIDTKEGKTIPGHELYGQIPGYLGLSTSTFYWLIVDAEVGKKGVRMQLVNDYGSEDLEAVLEQHSDSTYILKQGKGSTIKLPKNRKWMKLPSSLEFKIRKP